MFLTLLVDGGEVVFVGVGVIPMDFKHLRNKAPTGPPFELNYNVKRIADIALDGLKEDTDFVEATQKSTTDKANVLTRLQRAQELVVG
jgi:hypothetical protein